jgi:nicotinamidase-related amidase
MHSSGKSNSQDSRLTPDNAALLLLDYQPQTLAAVQSQDRTLIINSVLALAKAARTFEVPTIVTTLAAQNLNGPLLADLLALFPAQEPIDRTCINAFENADIVAAVRETRRKRLIIAGLCTEVAVYFAAQTATEEGYNVQLAADACAGTTNEAHQLALQQLAQAGVQLCTWQQLLLGWQRDWERTETAGRVRQIFRQHGGAYGQGIFQAQAFARENSLKGMPAPRRGMRPAGMQK